MGQKQTKETHSKNENEEKEKECEKTENKKTQHEKSKARGVLNVESLLKWIKIRNVSVNLNSEKKRIESLELQKKTICFVDI